MCISHPWLDDLTYIQCSGDAKIGFGLEYQDGSGDRHCRAKKKDFDTETIVTKFLDYASGGSAWMDDVEWEKIFW